MIFVLLAGQGTSVYSAFKTTILAIITMTLPETDAGFAEGIRLFNQGNFFEAHEAWERVWKRAEGEEKTFYQGLIQAAVALCHIQRGNYAGANSVYLKSWAKLAQLPAVWMGIELEQFRSELKKYFAPLRNFSGVNLVSRQSSGARQIAGIVRLPTIRWAPAKS